MSEQKHVVLYTDAGFIDKRRVGGWGIHGYTYTNEAPKKGTGNAQAIPTSAGYVTQKDKSEGATLVTIHDYIDGAGPLVDVGGSDQTELKALNVALNWASTQDDLSSITIISDSRNVMTGAKSYLSKWKSSDWKNSKGATVAYVNDWKDLDQIQAQLSGLGKSVSYNWVKGHDGNFGNEIADSYATIGNTLSMRGSEYKFLEIKASTGYWNPKVAPNKILASGRWYFSTNDSDYVRSTGETIYYIGDHGKDDEHIGKPSSDATMTVLFLKEADPVLEKLRAKAIEMDSRQLGSVMIGRLDYISVPKQYQSVLEHGTELMYWDDRRKDLFTGDEKRKQLLKERNPPALALYAVNALNMLEDKLESYLGDRLGLTVTNVTDQFYEDGKLKAEISQTLKCLPINVDYNLKTVNVKPDVKTRKIKLILGIDMAARNALSHAASENPKLEVLTWREGSKAFRYATVLTTDSYVGIWSSTTSNLILVSDGESDGNP